MIVVNGAHAGPRLWLSALIHGPEATGAEVIRRVLRETIDPMVLQGSIICAPIANPLAFQDSTYDTPYDGYNLNRVFPGNPNGSITHRMAAVLYEQVKRCDFIMDLHANAVPALQFCIVAHAPDPKVVERSFEIARAFGLTTRLMKVSEEAQWASSRSGTLLEVAARDGIPGCIAELLYWYRIDPGSVEVGTRGVLNIMKALGMIAGQIEKQDVLVIDGELAGAEQTCKEGGLVFFSKNVGDPVTQGETIAIVRDPYGDLLEEVKAPVTGWVTAYPLRRNQAATSGDTVAFFVYRKN
ncbi:MAG: succinylglutamate desuccinylase/aspartoacylase family protein [Nitrospira sp.]